MATKVKDYELLHLSLIQRLLVFCGIYGGRVGVRERFITTKDRKQKIYRVIDLGSCCQFWLCNYCQVQQCFKLQKDTKSALSDKTTKVLKIPQNNAPLNFLIDILTFTIHNGLLLYRENESFINLAISWTLESMLVILCFKTNAYITCVLTSLAFFSLL